MIYLQTFSQELLFADGGGTWKRGRNINYVVKKAQEGINQVEEWRSRWALDFLLKKRKKTKIGEKTLYGNELSESG